jgi:hypothetical protein
VTDLASLLVLHRDEPFPSSVVKGVDYGEVDPVMIDADIYGWASSVADRGSLTAEVRGRLEAARDALQRSMTSFPEGARPYYEQLLEIASAALE